MGNLFNSEEMRESEYDKYKNTFVNSTVFESVDFPTENGTIHHQKDNKENRIFIRNVWFKSEGN